MIGMSGEAVVDTRKAGDGVWRDSSRVDELVYRGDEGQVSDFRIPPCASMDEAVTMSDEIQELETTRGKAHTIQ